MKTTVFMYQRPGAPMEGSKGVTYSSKREAIQAFKGFCEKNPEGYMVMVYEQRPLEVYDCKRGLARRAS